MWSVSCTARAPARGRPPECREGTATARPPGRRRWMQALGRAAIVIPRLLHSHEGQGRVPLADGAQRLARRQPLVDALYVEAVLAGQHPELVPVPGQAHACTCSNSRGHLLGEQPMRPCEGRQLPLLLQVHLGIGCFTAATPCDPQQGVLDWRFQLSSHGVGVLPQLQRMNGRAPFRAGACDSMRATRSRPQQAQRAPVVLDADGAGLQRAPALGPQRAALITVRAPVAVLCTPPPRAATSVKHAL